VRIVGATIGVVLVRAYQVLLGPFMGGGCRFTPSCSNYAIEAFTQHGFWRGGWFAIRRIGRCHPFAQPGIDPVPEARDRSARAAH
jgi:putative membrane protein insertion efficiency factor